MELTWAVVGLSGAPVDSLGGPLGPSWAVGKPLGPSWGSLGPSWGRLRRLEGLLGPFWGSRGAVLGPSGRHHRPA